MGVASLWPVVDRKLKNLRKPRGTWHPLRSPPWRCAPSGTRRLELRQTRGPPLPRPGTERSLVDNLTIWPDRKSELFGGLALTIFLAPALKNFILFAFRAQTGRAVKESQLMAPRAEKPARVCSSQKQETNPKL